MTASQVCLETTIKFSPVFNVYLVFYKLTINSQPIIVVEVTLDK